MDKIDREREQKNAFSKVIKLVKLEPESNLFV